MEGIISKSSVAMLALPAPPAPLRALDDFKGDAQALVTDFFDAWTLELPPQLREVNDKCRDRFLRMGRTRFNVWFKLTTTMVDGIIEWAGGDDGWRESIEEFAGFKFAKPSAPEHQDSGQKRKAEEAVQPPAKEQCVSARLTQLGSLLDEVLPDKCYAVIETEAPDVNAITEPELTLWTDEVLRHIACRFGDWKVGMRLARQYGKQAKARLCLPAYGKTPGYKRDVGRIILQKCKNRLYVRRPLLSPPSRPATSPATAVFCTQHGNSYKTALVVNAIDLTDEAKPRFESKLKGLVGVDDNPQESKYKPCDEAPPKKWQQFSMAMEPSSGARSGAVQDGGVVVFGPATPLPHREGGSDAPAGGSDPPQGMVGAGACAGDHLRDGFAGRFVVAGRGGLVRKLGRPELRPSPFGPSREA